MVMSEETVKVSGKTFRTLYTADEIASVVERMAAQLRRDVGGENPLFVCMLGGAYVFAADVLREYGEPCELSFVKLSSYEGTQSTGSISTKLDIETDLRDRHVVVLEDIVETGRTMHEFVASLERRGPASVSIAALVVKPECMEEKVDIKYVGFKMKKSDFIIGYGMDYNQIGRNLADIYINVEESNAADGDTRSFSLGGKHLGVSVSVSKKSK